MQTVLIVEDDAALGEALGDTLELAGYRPQWAEHAARALEFLGQEPIDLVISDVHMKGMDGHALLQRIKVVQPDLPVLLMTAYGTIDKAVAAIRHGAADYLTKPFAADALLAAVQKHIRPAAELGTGPVTADPGSQRLYGLAARVARAEATIMITGESGTGKEVLARYIHEHSPRCTGPFTGINCAAIPDNMLEATLFGYEKGAFTGAYKSMPGKFEQTQGGTLLLDEVSEMDLGLQAKLLRVLQEREVERLGGNRVIPLDVRVLATSNRDMRAMVAEGRFREDLYYRLNVFPLRLPPLRERPGDIVPLAERLLARAAGVSGLVPPRLTDTAKERLLAYAWPGNVRELDNLMQRAMILAEDAEVCAEDLAFEPIDGSPVAAPAAVAPTAPRLSLPPAANLEPSGGLGDDLKQHEFDRIREALRQGSRKAAAERLGISPRTLRYKVARLKEAGFEL